MRCCYRTAWNRYRKGWFPDAIVDATGHIRIPLKHFIEADKEENLVAVYARVSSSENRTNLDSQAQRLVEYCIARGYKIDKVVKETGSGLNDKRPKLEKLLLDKSIKKIVVEHKNRLSIFGLNYIEKLLESDGRCIEIVNNAEGDKEDLVQDFVSVITSFCVRLYGQRRSKLNTEKLIRELQNSTEDEISDK